MTYINRVVLQNTAGCAISTESIYDDIYLEVTATQDVHVATNNSASGIVLTSGSTWTGTSETTLGVGAIQINFFSDQNCTIYLDQSMDGTNWDIVDSFTYLYTLGGDARTFQATASYLRVRVKNNGTSSTSVFRLQTVLAPIIPTEPRALTSDGNFKVATNELLPTFGNSVQGSPMSSLRTTDTTRLAGAAFSGSVIDSNYWVSGSVIADGNAAIGGGIITLSSGSIADGSIKVNSLRNARYVAGRSNYFRGVLNNPSTTGACTKRWGAFDVNDGYFFEYSGSALSVANRKTGADSKITSGSFNGNYGTIYTLDTLAHTYEIHWTNSSAWYLIDNKIIHKTSGSLLPLVASPHLKIGLECSNTGTNANANTLQCRVASIGRMGALTTQSTHKYTAGTQTGVLCKVGAGNLQSIIISSPETTSVVTIYDGVSASGSVIFAHTYTFGVQASVLPIQVDFKGIPFSTGLFYTVGTAAANVTMIYE